MPSLVSSIIVDPKNPTSFLADGLGETKPTIVIGGKSDRFVPNVNYSYECDSAWRREQFFFNLNRSSAQVSQQTPTFDSKQIRLATGDETDIFYIAEDGTFKWDIEYAKKPVNLAPEWDIVCSPGLMFRCQTPPPAEMLKGTLPIPERNFNSWTVHCLQKGHYKSREGKTLVNYQTGKLLQIYRPVCTDADGKTAWADILIENGKFRVTLPQDFMETARYPITLDPTFGHTASGTYNGGGSTGAIYTGANGAPSGNGAVTSIYLDVVTYASGNWKVGLYDDNSNPHNKTGTERESALGSVSRTFQQFAANDIPVANGTTYWICWETTCSSYYYYYDTSGVGILHDNNSYGDAWPSTFTVDGSSSGEVASYAEYEAPASAALTGTVTDAISESDIVAGGKTIILTLTNDTFV
jgi:hypothetical protein